MVLSEIKREDLLKLLASRGLSLSPTQDYWVQRCISPSLFNQWFDRALHATSVEEVFLLDELPPLPAGKKKPSRRATAPRSAASHRKNGRSQDSHSRK